MNSTKSARPLALLAIPFKSPVRSQAKRIWRRRTGALMVPTTGAAQATRVSRSRLPPVVHPHVLHVLVVGQFDGFACVHVH